LLFLLDNLNIISFDWATLWKLWPVLLIAIGLEIILGRRVSFGAILLVVIIVVIGGAILWWSVIADTGDQTTEHITWSRDGIERAELELDLGVGKLQLGGYGDMSDLLVADLDLASGAGASHDVEFQDDIARGWIIGDRDALALPAFLGGEVSKWDLILNDRVRWEMDVNSGVGDVRLDLSNLRVSDLNLHSGVGSVQVTLPGQGASQVRIDGGIGDINVTIPLGAQARFRVDRGISDLTVGSRFERRGDYYETEGFSTAESFIDIEIDIGIGNITVR
jgi:hypothetical protein